MEIRLLGSLNVRRADGSYVQTNEWRTRKTQDLLRILALQAGKRVSVDSLVESLWPGVDSERGMASLRTAASQIRRVLRRDCVERVHRGVILRGVWVDTQTFAALARECQLAASEGRFPQAVAAARQASALYLHDLDISSGDASDWFVAERESLRDQYANVMDDAAAAATSLGWMRDAADFAERAMACRPYGERAYRSAMLAYAGLGEVERAFAVYETCKARLVDELGVDPSAQTQAAHLQLLRMDPPRVVEAPFVGREAQLAHLSRRAAELSEQGGGCVVVTAAPRTGISRLLDETAAHCEEPVYRPAKYGVEQLDQVAAGIVLFDDVERWPSRELRRLAEEAPEANLSQVVLAAFRTGVREAADEELNALVSEGLVERFDVPPLLVEDVTTLTELLISGKPTDELVNEVQHSSGGQPGLIVQTVRDWLHAGRLVHTGRGLDLLPDATYDPTTADHQLAQLRERLSQQEQAVLEVIAVVATGVSATGIETVLARPEDLGDERVGPPDSDAIEVARIAAMLEDITIVTADDRGRYTVRSPVLRDALRAWMRPAARRQLHRRVAERLSPAATSRVRHWIEAGEPKLACAEAMGAAVQAMAEFDFAEAQRLLHQVQDLLDQDTAGPEDQLEVLQRLIICCEQLGLETEAEQARATARSLARQHGLTLATPPSEEPVLAPVTLLRRGRVPLVERLGMTASTSPTPEVESLLRESMAFAQSHADEEDEAEARLLLAGFVLVPRRRFAEARLVLSQGQHSGTGNKSLTQLTLHEADVLLGSPSVDLAAIDHAWQESPRVGGFASGLPAAVLSALARHHQNQPDADAIRDQAAAEAEAHQLDGPWRWVVARMLVERGQLDRARAVALGAPWRVGSPTAQILALLGKAELSLAEGDRESAAISLLRGVEVAERTGATLLMPEVASRLVLAEDDNDHESALEYLDLAESALGEAAMGRERVTIMLARAKLRASAGRALSAAEVAAQAETLATSLGLRYSAQEAAMHRARFLERAHSSLPTRQRNRGVRQSS